MTVFFYIRIQRIVLYSILLSTVLLSVSPVIISWIVNTPYVKAQISTQIYKKSGIKIDGSRFSIALFPVIHANVQDIEYKLEPETGIRVDSVRLNFELLPLLRGKVNLSDVLLVRPDLFFSDVASKDAADTRTISWSDRNRLLEKIFSLLPEKQEAITIIIEKGKSDFFSDLSGLFYISKGEKEILLSFEAEKINVNLSEYKQLRIHQYIDLGAIHLKGVDTLLKINQNGDISGQIIVESLKLSAHNQDILIDSGKLKLILKLSDDHYQIELSPSILKYPEGTLEAGFFSDVSKSDSMIRFKGHNIHAGQARKTALCCFKKNKTVDTLFGIIHSGIIEDIVVNFKSDSVETLLNGKSFTLEGTLQNGVVHIPETGLTAKKVQGSASVEEGILSIKTSNSEINGSRIIDGTLEIDLLNYNNHPFEGDFKLDADLATLPQTLITLLPDTKLATELKKVQNVNGRADARLTLALTADQISVNVKTAPFSISGFYDRISGKINLETIAVTYKPGHIFLHNMTGTLNDNRFKNVSADVEFKKDVFLNLQAGSGWISLDTTVPWMISYKKIREIIAPVSSGSGILHLSSVTLSGPVTHPEKWSYDFRGRTSSIRLGVPGNQNELDNLSCVYRIKDNRIDLKNLYFKTNRLSWLKKWVKGKHLNSISTPLIMLSGNLQIIPEDNFFKGQLRFNNGPLLTIDAKGPNISELSLNSLQITDAPITDAKIIFNSHKTKPLFEFTGKLNTATFDKIIVPDSFWSKKIDFLTANQPMLIHTDETNSLNISLKKLNLNALISTDKKNTFNSRIIPKQLINFNAESLTYKKLDFTDIVAKISFQKDRSYIRVKQGFLCGINLSGYINIDDGLMRIPFEIKDGDNIQTLLSCLFQKENLMDGKYSLICNLNTESPIKNFKNDVNGSIILNATSGRIYKLTLLSRILSALNVSKIFKGKIPNITQSGLEYKTITLAADIKNSRINLTKAIVDGTDMALTCSGWIDPLNDELNLTCLAAPFKTLDLIIKKIPVVTTLLGERLIFVPVKATGSLSDPNVIPLHPSAVGKSLVDLMTGLVKAPITLLDEIAPSENKPKK